MAKHTISDLYQIQSMPLSIKVRMTENRIRWWIDEYGEDGVYVSFSGGKDSTVLLDIVRKHYPDVLAAFVDTGLEYPEIRDFVKTFDNVEWLKPKKTFKQVIEEYGYPFISKEVSDKIQGARKYIKALNVNKEDPEYQNLMMGIIPSGTLRYKQVMGTATQKDGSPSAYNLSKYKFFLEAPFEISAKCCDAMKKSPVHAFGKQTGRKPITAQMASESRVRTFQWLKNGCNGFEMKSPISNPMSFWTEQDVLLYIKENNLPICSVYGDIVEVDGKEVNVKDADTKALFDLDRPFLTTTGCDRTGCMFCGYGCHLEKPGEGRFLRMKDTHPKQYDYIMRSTDNGGLNYKEIIDWINEHGNFHIEY